MCKNHERGELLQSHYISRERDTMSVGICERFKVGAGIRRSCFMFLLLCNGDTVDEKFERF